jgi:hypothetical protein
MPATAVAARSCHRTRNTCRPPACGVAAGAAAMAAGLAPDVEGSSRRLHPEASRNCPAASSWLLHTAVPLSALTVSTSTQLDVG